MPRNGGCSGDAKSISAGRGMGLARPLQTAPRARKERARGAMSLRGRGSRGPGGLSTGALTGRVGEGLLRRLGVEGVQRLGAHLDEEKYLGRDAVSGAPVSGIGMRWMPPLASRLPQAINAAAPGSSYSPQRRSRFPREITTTAASYTDKPKSTFTRRMRAAKPRNKKYNIRYDVIPGLGLAIHPSGSCTFFLRRVVRGRIRYVNIGATDAVTLLQIRREARKACVP